MTGQCSGIHISHQDCMIKVSKQKPRHGDGTSMHGGERTQLSYLCPGNYFFVSRNPSLFCPQLKKFAFTWNLLNLPWRPRGPGQQSPFRLFFPSYTILSSHRSLTGKSYLEIPQGTQMSWGLLRPTPRGWGLSAGAIQGDPISFPRASWTQKGTAFTLLVANMPQH